MTWLLQSPIRNVIQNRLRVVVPRPPLSGFTRTGGLQLVRKSASQRICRWVDATLGRPASFKGDTQNATAIVKRRTRAALMEPEEHQLEPLKRAQQASPVALSLALCRLNDESVLINYLHKTSESTPS